jgi:hypothetical protein
VQHVEYPELSAEAKSAVEAGLWAIDFPKDICYLNDRKRMAAFLREAMRQAQSVGVGGSSWQELQAIADNLHSPPPPPPPPTLAEAREAARQLAGPSAEVVHAFLFSLLEKEET